MKRAAPLFGAGEFALPSLSILLVDDNRFFLTLEKQFLQKTPATIIEATSAEEALMFCRQQRPDLIYMAHDPAGIDGASACRQIKADPLLASIPVVLVYDQDASALRSLCEASGSDGTVTKPLDRRLFLDVGCRFLEGIREQRSPCLFQVSYLFRGEKFSCTCLDISTGGLFLKTTAPPAAGTPLELTFSLPGPASPIDCRGNVTWMNTPQKMLKPNYPHGFGVKFSEISDQAVARIKIFLERNRR